MEALDLLKIAVEKDASDIFLIPGVGYSFKLNGRIYIEEKAALAPEALSVIIDQIYDLAQKRSMDKINKIGDDDFSFSVKGLSRFRVSVFKQRGTLAAVIRVVNFELPDYETLHIPKNVIETISGMKKGLVLVTGPAGSGKSTTLACIIDEINKTRSAHVITLEDPIEYLHRHKKSIVTQREIATDTVSYVSALRAALRQAPDVILLGELRDYETIRTAMTAAETGHLVISTLHTVGAANSIDRIIDAFPENQQSQIRIQLSMVLQAVISQQLLPTTKELTIPAFEIMFLNNAIRNIIRESKIHQIDSAIISGQEEGMVAMDISLLNLYKDGIITKETALIYSTNRDVLEKRMERS